MIDMTYDPEADAVYIYIAHISRGSIDRTDEIAPNVFVDRDAKGRILGIEVLTASKVLAPGDWRKARPPGTPASDAAE
jgi:uncharacterized protein YuzE